MSLTSLERNVRAARKLRADLIARLGGRCIQCGSTEQLEFDHIRGRTWSARSKSRWTRMYIYKREAAEGLIQLLCRGCNGRKGEPVPAEPAWVADDA